MLGRVIRPLFLGADVVLTERQPQPSADQARRSPLKIPFPVLFGEKQGAIVEAQKLVDEDVAAIDEVWPKVADTDIEAGLQVYVEKRE